jgi:hypothetical protein
MAMPHLVLLGDSIFDNAAYVPGRPAVIAQLQAALPAGWQTTLLAVDGHVAAGVHGQLSRLPADATHLAISAGGNDALVCASILGQPAGSVAEVVRELADIQDEFRREYHEMLTAVLMRKLFERFLLNFFKHEQSVFRVNSRRFPWAGTSTANSLLPMMHTDVTLTNGCDWIVIDAKYTPSALQRHPFGTPTLKSPHLYQLFAYLKNLPAPAGTTIDGMIVYPLGPQTLDATFQLHGHSVRVCTLINPDMK